MQMPKTPTPARLAALHSTLALCALSALAACTPLEFGARPEGECAVDDDCGGGALCRARACVTPASEECDGVDNDLDGQSDEGLLNACGACGAAPQELCDQADNDCDERVDEGFEAVGETCDLTDDPSAPAAPGGARGLWACAGGALVCVPTNAPNLNSELCDNRDNDLDGAVDEGISLAEVACPPDSCRAAATPSCREGVIAQGCDVPLAETDDTCDGVDDDCDGAEDEGFVEGASVPCGGVGACDVSAPRACVGSALVDGAACAEVLARPELCDGIDNNCDGQVDELARLTFSPDPEGEAPIDGVPAAQVGEVCRLAVGVCAEARYQLACAGGEERRVCSALTPEQLARGDRDPTDPLALEGVRDLCDGRDEDCDGVVDEDSLPFERPCADALLAERGARGVSACYEGVRVELGCEGEPRGEVCNAADDDLDGRVDEESAGAPGGCSPRLAPDLPDADAFDANGDGLDGRAGAALFV
ncbi:MAG: hypothetical protein FJ138_08345, partial [Deltaproteobacteria bacterium]|nr:hypothetical protein [Deltaproteobacteria bacterium]